MQFVCRYFPRKRGFMSYIKEPFEKLDVMSDYLNNALASNPVVGEAYCKLMIKTLTGLSPEKIKVYTQKIIHPSSPEKRGIRLDIEVKEYAPDNSEDPDAIVSVYDIEPHRQKDIDSFPKKSRFYQAKQDSAYLKSGEKYYSKLPNLYIISITNYDPFDKNSMVYSIKNKCEEYDDLCYDDGVRIYYFNTAGTENGSLDLKKFLTYLEDSSDENNTTEATKELRTYVDYIKSKPEEWEGYMTWGDKIDAYVQEEVAKAVAAKDAEIADKDAQIAEITANKDAEIARLKELLEKNKDE